MVRNVWSQTSEVFSEISNDEGQSQGIAPLLRIFSELTKRMLL
jgi:hypothetical protein